MKPRLYLDVDNVVNGWHADHVWPSILKGNATSTTGRYKIIWSPEMVEELSKLDVELVWTTSWVAEAAPQIGTLVGFGADATHLSIPDGFPRFPSIDWKMQAIIADQKANPSPFLWLDDEIRTAPHALAALSMGGLAITPYHYTGISPEDIETMRAYIEKVSADAVAVEG